MISSLENLHNHIKEALNTNSYLGLEQQTPPKLVKQTSKTTNLQEVFRTAQRQIENGLKNQKDVPIDKQITQLHELTEDGKLLYKRYEKATKRWCRVFIKGIVYYTPVFLKKFLPKSFTKIMVAELNTFKEYSNYNLFLLSNICDLTHKLPDSDINQNQPLPDQIRDPKSNSQKSEKDHSHSNNKNQDILDDTNNSFSSDSKKNQQQPKKNEEGQSQIKKPTYQPNIDLSKITDEIQTLHTSIRLQIEGFGKKRCRSIQEFKLALKNISNDVQILNTLDPQNAQTLLNQIGLDKKSFDLFTGKNSSIMLDSTLLLTTHIALKTRLEGTIFYDSFIKALDESYVSFGETAIGDKGHSKKLMLRLFDNNENKEMDESSFANFQGRVNIFIVDINNLSLLTTFLVFLKSNDKCRPHSLQITFDKPSNMNLPLLNFLNATRIYDCQITIKNLEEIDFQIIKPSEQTELEFIKNFKNYKLPDVKRVALSSEAINKCLTDDLTPILSVLPKKDQNVFKKENANSTGNLNQNQTVIHPPTTDNKDTNSKTPPAKGPFILNLKNSSTNEPKISTAPSPISTVVPPNKNAIENYVDFVVRTVKFDPNPIITLKLCNGDKVEKMDLKTFEEYNGNVCVSISDINFLTQLQVLENFLNQHVKCRPSKIQIKLPLNTTLTPTLSSYLSSFEKYQSEIILENLCEINPTINFPEKELKAFIDTNPSPTTPAKILDTNSGDNEFVEFGERGLPGGGKLLMLRLFKDGKETSLKEDQFLTYSKKVRFSTQVDTLAVLKSLIQFLEKNKNCRPSSVEIKLSAVTALTPELFEQLQKLKNYIKDIKVENVNEINFEKLNLPENIETEFINQLDEIKFLNLCHISLSNHVLKWERKHFSKILSICPDMDLLKKACEAYPDLKGIVIPSQLADLKEMDFSQFPTSSILNLLQRFKNLTEVKLHFNNEAACDECIKKGYLTNIKILDLQCDSLTTDIIPSLTSLKNLTALYLPDLLKGKKPLNSFPKFDDPFKIKLFYSSGAIRNQASSYYTGPWLWASTFQIPLARQGVTPVFPKEMSVLDPISVSHWLHPVKKNHPSDVQKWEFDYLKAEPSINTIIADFNEGLNDENVASFFKKFPKLETISLYNCPNVTEKGIIDLLKSCPSVRYLDLTNCSNVKEGLFDPKVGPSPFVSLDKLILNGTAISQSMIDKSAVKQKVSFQNTILKITNDQLTDEQALEKILTAIPLNKLTRLDLEGCTNLTNPMLSQLLDRLNDHYWLPSGDENPKRLNLATLNLTGCSKITLDAFHQNIASATVKPEKNIAIKHLENLHRIIIGGTKINKGIFQKICENQQIIVQDQEIPLTIETNLEKHLEACQTYYKKKELAQKGDKNAEAELQELARSFMKHRIALELFASECADQNSVKQIFFLANELKMDQFRDFAISFGPIGKQKTSYNVHRDILYTQSRDFMNNKLRPGQFYSKGQGIDIENAHATPEASQAVIDLFYNKNCIPNLKWKTAADVAELVGPKNLDLPRNLYTQLLNQFRSKFNISDAEEMCVTAVQLSDRTSLSHFRTCFQDLLNLLDLTKTTDVDSFRIVAPIVKYYFPELKDLVKDIENNLNAIAIAKALKGF